MKAVLTITEAAYYLSSTEDALRELVKARAMPFRKLGRRVLFVQRDLDAWLAKLPGCSVQEALKHVGHTVDTLPATDPNHVPRATPRQPPVTPPAGKITRLMAYPGEGS